MNPAELRKELRLRVPRTINLGGRDDLLKREALEVITGVLVQRGTEAINVVTFGPDKPSSAELQELREPPFGESRRLAVLRGKWDPAPAARLAGEETTLVSWDGMFGLPDVQVDCARLFGQKLRGWLKTRARLAGVDIDHDDVAKLVDAFGNDSALLMQQVEKLSLLDHVEQGTVEHLCQQVPGMNIREVVDAVTKQQFGAAVGGASTLVEQGEALPLLVALQRRFAMILRVEAGLKLEDMPEWEAERVQGLKGMFPFETALEMADRLAVLEWRLKRGAAMEELVVEVFYMAGGKDLTAGGGR